MSEEKEAIEEAAQADETNPSDTSAELIEASAPQAASENQKKRPSPLSREELEQKLTRAERLLYGRIIAGAVLFCAFAAFDVSVALTGKMEEHGGKLLVLLVLAILALPRQVLPPALVNQLPMPERKEKITRVNQIQKWLVGARAIFFLSAIFLFAVLPRIV